MYEEAVLAAVSTMVIGVALILDDKKKKKRRNRTIWVQEWIKQREEHGAYHALVNELCLSAREDYRSFMRMNTETFTEWTLRSLALAHKPRNLRDLELCSFVPN